MRKMLGKMFLRMGETLALGLDAAEWSPKRADLGWGRSSPRDEDRLIGASDRQQTRQRAMDLRRNNPVVAGVCDRLALFVVGTKGLQPQVKTSDAAWNKDAEQWWNEIYTPNCDSRGRSSLVDLQAMAVSMRPTHGGLYIQKIEDGTIRPIECERIRDPQSGRSDGWTEGVRVNPTTGQVEKYLVHERDKDGGFSFQHRETAIDAESIIPVIKPPWRADQVREIPDLVPIITALQDIGEINKMTLATIKAQTKFVGFLKKQSGVGMPLPRRGQTQTVEQRQQFEHKWGTILEGLPNEAIDLLVSPTPQSNHVPYIKYAYALCSAALGFPYEFFTLDLSGLDFSRQKGMLLLVNYATRPWKQWLADTFLMPLWQWRLAKEMGPGGDLRPAPSQLRNGFGMSEWSKVDWQFPEELWIDRQEAQQADTLEIQAGLGTLSAAAKRRGYDFAELLEAKAKDEMLIDAVEARTGVPRERLVKMQIPGQTDTTQDKESKDTRNQNTKGNDNAE